MRKIFIFAACLATLASCIEQEQQPIKLYCEHEVSRLYNTPDAEMDTLSYATGMNLGLVASLNFNDFGLNMDEVISVLDEYAGREISEETINEWNEYMQEFGQERIQPYMMAKQAQSRIETDRPDTLTLPTLYDETYTKEKMTEYVGIMSAHQLFMQRIPANLTWVYKAMRDAAQVNDASEIDSLMSITQLDFNNTLSNYHRVVAPSYNKELADNWLEMVSNQPNVHMFSNEKSIYYRVNNQGDDSKPVNASDTIAIKYAVYSRTGRDIESNATYAKRLEQQKKMYENHPMLPDSVRTQYATQFDEMIAESDVMEFKFDRLMSADVQELLKHIGEGGSITIWGSGAEILGYYNRTIQQIPANEAVVVNIELVDVVTVDPLSIQPQAVPMNMPGQTVRPSTMKGAPIQVTPQK